MRGFRTRSYKKQLKEMEFNQKKKLSEGYDGCVQIFGLKGCQVDRFGLYFELQKEQPGIVSSNHREKESRLI